MAEPLELSVEDASNTHLWTLEETKAELLRELVEKNVWRRLYHQERAAAETMRREYEDRIADLTPISLED